MGTKWAMEKRSAVLGVPSVVIPSELKYLLNPEHPDFSKIEIGPSKPVGWDPRLLTLLNKIPPSPKLTEKRPPIKLRSSRGGLYWDRFAREQL
jgi:hypothetical protein